VGGLNKRNGLIMATDMSEDGSQITIKADVPLVQMFGYSTDIRYYFKFASLPLSHRLTF
jgi:translation elongation factor EF-G